MSCGFGCFLFKLWAYQQTTKCTLSDIYTYNTSKTFIKLLKELLIVHSKRVKANLLSRPVYYLFEKKAAGKFTFSIRKTRCIPFDYTLSINCRLAVHVCDNDPAKAYTHFLINSIQKQYSHLQSLTGNSLGVQRK